MTGKRSLRVCAFLLASIFILSPANPVPAHEESSPSLAGEVRRQEVRIPIKNFTLTDQSGKLFRLQSLRGKVIVVSFIYTTCPDVCPLITSSLRLVQKELSLEERGSVFLLSITTDPEVDGPEVLKSYAERYGVDFSNWSFLTGDARTLAPVLQNFGVKVERRARGLVNHTSLTAIIDGKGNMRFAYTGASPDYEQVLQDVRALLAPRQGSAVP